MSSANTMTGRLGKFVVGDNPNEDLIARTTQWAVNPTLASSNEWGDSDSAGYTNRSSGRRDATFTAEGKYDTSDIVYDIFAPGDIAQSTLWMAYQEDPAIAIYWDFPRALNSEFSMTVNIDTEEVIGWTSSWGADGIFYRPGQENAPVRTMPE